MTFNLPHFSDGGIDFCRALYDYEATAPEELSFYEGQIIKITRRVIQSFCYHSGVVLAKSSS